MPNNWQSPFAELAYFIRNFFLRFTTNTFMSGIPNHSLHSLITSTDTVRKIFIKTLFIVNSNDFSCVLLIGIKCRRVLKSPIYADEIKILSITKEEATDSYVMFIPFYRFVYKELFVFLWRLSLFYASLAYWCHFFIIT